MRYQDAAKLAAQMEQDGECKHRVAAVAFIAHAWEWLHREGDEAILSRELMFQIVGSCDLFRFLTTETSLAVTKFANHAELGNVEQCRLLYPEINERIFSELMQTPEVAPQAPRELIPDGPFKQHQKSLVLELNRSEGGWISFDDFAVIPGWADNDIVKYSDDLVTRFNKRAKDLGIPWQVCRHQKGFQAKKC